MEDVELDRGHAVEGALENFDWHEVASAVDHEAAPAEARRVVNRHDRKERSGGVGLDELLESCEAAASPRPLSRLEDARWQG